MRNSLDYAGLAQLCARSPIMRKIMRAHNRIIQPSLILAQVRISVMFIILSLILQTQQASGNATTETDLWTGTPTLPTTSPITLH